MPHASHLLPIADQLRDAARTVEATMVPAPEALIRECLAGLVMTMAIDRRSDVSVEMFADKAVELLGTYPADIWVEAANECLLALDWFPTIRQLRDRLAPGMTRRRRLFDRFQRMADAARPEPRIKPGDEAARAAAVARIYADLKIKKLNGRPVFGPVFDIPETTDQETNDGDA